MLDFVPSDLSQQRLIREGFRVGYLACEAAGFRYVLIKRSSVEREQVQFLAYDFLLERCDLPNQICNRLWREREREARSGTKNAQEHICFSLGSAFSVKNMFVFRFKPVRHPA